MKQHILIVDDDEIVLTGLAANLEKEGYETSVAMSAQEALTILGRARVNLVLTDLVMEGMSGLDLLRRIAREARDLPVVVITGHGTATSAIEAVREGAADYIQKPARPDEIAHRVRMVLDAHNLRRKLLRERESIQTRHREDQNRSSRVDRMSSLALLAEGLASELAEATRGWTRAAPKLLAGLPEDSPLRPLAEAGEADVRRVGALVRNLRAIVTSEPINLESLDLNELVRQFLDSRECRTLQHEHVKIQVGLRLRENLPSVRAARRRVLQLLSVLVGNAFEAMPQGGRLTIETDREYFSRPSGHYREAAEGDYVLLRIHNSGHLDAEHLDRAFEPYYATHRLERRRAGGFGLTNVYTVMRAHGGFIDCHASPEEGTVIVLHFPVPHEATDAPSVAHASFAGTERVLVVDDHEEHRTAARQILEGLGYGVETLGSAGDALAFFAERAGGKGEAVALVVIDLVLGEERDGVDVYRRILEHVPGQKAILAGGFAETERTVQARELGIAAYVQKPFTTENLGRAVRQALDG